MQGNQSLVDLLLAHESVVRISVFVGILAIMAGWEIAAPKRRLEIPRLIRWTNNLALIVVDTILVRLAFPVLAVGLAIIAQEQGWGIFNILSVPLWVAVLFSMLFLDLAIYIQHVMFHAVPFLWRLHRVHHADLDIDITTGLRFHPIEILISMMIKLVVVVILGAPAISVLLFEIVLNASSIFNHGNARIPVKLDQILRLVIVTPDMHRVHHSIHQRETDSNFGFNLPWWDHLFGTYISEPIDGHLDMKIGIQYFRTRRDLWLDRMLIQPLRRTDDSHIIDESQKIDP